MNSYLLKRVMVLIPVLIGMTIIVFSIIHAIPGDPAETILGQKATEQSKQALRGQLGLDKPWLQQYFNYMGDLLQGDLGTSIRTKTPIAKEIMPYLAATPTYGGEYAVRHCCGSQCRYSKRLTAKFMV